jgi:hypothetical protein
MTLSSFSGRIDTLESQVTQLFQQLLLKVDLSTLTDLNSTTTTQVDAFDASLDNHESRLDNLEGLYSNLVYNYNQHVASYTGHTGATTGDGVHGHT